MQKAQWLEGCGQRMKDTGLGEKPEERNRKKERRGIAENYGGVSAILVVGLFAYYFFNGFYFSGGFYFSKAWLRSAMMSSMCSTPMERRTVEGVMCCWANSSGLI